MEVLTHCGKNLKRDYFFRMHRFSLLIFWQSSVSSVEACHAICASTVDTFPKGSITEADLRGQGFMENDFIHTRVTMTIEINQSPGI